MTNDLPHSIPDRHRRHTTLVWTAGLGLFCLLLFFVALVASSNTRPVMPEAIAREHMEHWLIDRPRQVAGEVKLQHSQALVDFYYARNYQPIWLDGYQLGRPAKQLIQALEETVADDWRRYDYRITTLAREADRLTNLPRQATAVEVLLTDALITYSKEVINKELLPDTNESDHPVVKVANAQSTSSLTDEDILARLGQAVNSQQLEAFVDQLTPNHSGYLALRNQLNHYLALANSGLWRPMPALTKLRPGDSHQDIGQLRWLLIQTGDYPGESLSWLFSDSEVSVNLPPGPGTDTPNELLTFDDNLIEGIKQFQQRYGLPSTGELDEKTLAWLNLPPFQMAQKIALNMKRWRHLPEQLGYRYVMVNMADFRLQYVEGGDTELDMKVIIGKLSRRTPVMVDLIREMELAPTWGVPYRIAVQYLLPKFRRNPEYIHQKGFQILEKIDGELRYVNPDDIDWKQVTRANFNYRIIQKAGGENALGQVKFLFPNPQSIYLHDTSQPQLFKLDKRALSSGCVRVEKPLELAEKLLQGQPGWNRLRVEETITQNRTTRLRLKQPVPVYLMYWTTWVDPKGRLQIRDDIYGRDLIAGQRLSLKL